MQTPPKPQIKSQTETNAPPVKAEVALAEMSLEDSNERQAERLHLLWRMPADSFRVNATGGFRFGRQIWQGVSRDSRNVPR